jgi:hypothetical protein
VQERVFNVSGEGDGIGTVQWETGDREVNCFAALDEFGIKAPVSLF